MGEHAVSNCEEDAVQRKKFIHYLLKDIKALEIMLDDGLFETDIQRIGAEQELCLVDPLTWRPAMVSLKILEKLKDPQFTTELALFNLEINLEPTEFSGTCFSSMEKQLRTLLDKLKKVGDELNTKIIMTGILPTIRRSDLNFNNITPNPRYKALNDAMYKTRSEDFELNIEGVDELIAKQKNILVEACNTSFQIHLQVSQDEFIEKYNWAQAISGPVLAVATNSPLLLGKRLWSETRIAVFQQAIDLRNTSLHLREKIARVTFGEQWLKTNIIEHFRKQIVNYNLLVSSEVEEDSLEMLKEGKVPALKALNVHSGTIYKWNRPCYGITNGKAHLRIENRYIPSGPTVLDEMANMAFWLGVMNGMPSEYQKFYEKTDFDEVKANFLKAAIIGLDTSFNWVNGHKLTSREIILDELIPIARDGLKKANIEKEDIDKYLDIIAGRVEKQQTGGTWLQGAYSKLKRITSREEAITATVAEYYKKQEIGKPVHQWSMTNVQRGRAYAMNPEIVEQIMKKKIVTVLDNELVHLVANIMDWENVNFVPVENPRGELVGLITSALLVDYYTHSTVADIKNLTVDEIMIRDMITITPEASLEDALQLMQKNNVDCLPVISDKILVGVLTEYDLVRTLHKSIL